MDTGFVLTESGRLFNLNPMREGKDALEFFNGEWTADSPGIYMEDIMLGRSLSLEEVSSIMESVLGRPLSPEEVSYIEKLGKSN